MENIRYGRPDATDEEVIEAAEERLERANAGRRRALTRVPEPLNPADWPLTGHAWRRCRSGAQRAGQTAASMSDDQSRPSAREADH